MLCPSPTSSAVSHGPTGPLRGGKPIVTALRQRVFLSYHYCWDHDRAALIRGLAPDRFSKPLADSEWDQLAQGGDAAVGQWIGAQIAAASCTVVLITSSTRGRRLIEHEVLTSWKQRKGVFGLHIHNLPDGRGATGVRGPNPFSDFRMARDNQRLSDIVPTYDLPYRDTAVNLRHLAAMLPEWVQEANAIRRAYSQ